MINPKVPIASGLVLALALSATAAGPPSGAAAATPYRGPACFWSRNIDSFAAPDDRTLYLRVGVRDVYELRLFAPCLDVDWTQHLAVRSRGSSWICEGRNSNVEIFSPSPIGHQRCVVDSVRKLNPDEIAALPRRARP